MSETKSWPERDPGRDAGPWRYRYQRKRDGPAHDMDLHMWERSGGQRRGDVTLSDDVKINVDGVVSLSLAVGQYKYADEMIGQVYRRGHNATLPRRAGDYQRLQVYFGAIDEWTSPLLAQVSRLVGEILLARVSP